MLPSPRYPASGGAGPLRKHAPTLSRAVRAAAAACLAVVLGGSLALGQSPSVPPPAGPPAPEAPVASGAPIASAVPGEPRVRALADREVFGFLPYWELADASRTVDLDKLTTLAWFGVEAGPNGRLDPEVQ